MGTNDKTANETDAALLSRLKEGDSTALEEIYAVYYERVRFFTSNILAGDEECEDITVKAFHKIWQKRTKLKTFDHIIGLLLKTAKNLCLDYLRKKKIDKKNFKAYAYHLKNEFHNPEEANVDQELLSFIELSMGESLRGNKKETLLMTIEGKKDSEIAASLNITIQTVQNYRYLALKLLRKQFLASR